ncbi:M48 family metallopeptidase [Sphingomonas lutea]|uniref:M48 family metallopeptidase n=2 Tax=Sphingomonas lutea TaxID=1045317 RepID=A0A7G9SII9_9SPHN|nr:M48 family metallopeptidase [Sphingomonas lutea]
MSGMWSTARSDAALEARFPVPIDVRPMRSARRFRLRFDAAAGVLKLTCPQRTSRTAALAWALDQRDWIDRQVAQALPGEPFVPGATIPIEGIDTLLLWDADLPRTPALADGVLSCGGPGAGFAARIDRFLKARALDRMRADVADYCAKAGIDAATVSVGDAGSRWGSCSSERRIRLSWRLILAPPHVRRFVAAHEVAHLVHLNHGPDFKALEARLFGPGLAEAKADLRKLGPRIRRIGRRL